MPGGAVFVYGTLMADEVVRLLLKRVPPSKPATLAGHRRHAVKGQVFPAIVPAPAPASVRGKVLLQLTPRELEILDGGGRRGNGGRRNGAPGWGRRGAQRGPPHARRRPCAARRGCRPASQTGGGPLCSCGPLNLAMPAPHPSPQTVYEAEEYYRASVSPQLDDGTSVDADVYIWKDAYRWGSGGWVGDLVGVRG
jgi:hypothetical protein